MLREARLQRGFSQSRLARESGVPQSVVSAYESGSREPSVSALRRLARALAMDVALVPAGRVAPDPQAMARQLEDVLGLAEAMHLRPRARPLRFPALARSA
jgi:transcriptional regulator with XRE-family HTH domain